MKKRSLLSIAIAFSLAMLFSSCDLFDKADDISLTRDLTQTLNVSESNSGTDLSYSKSFIIDATTDPEVDKYKDKINEVEVNKITYKISNFVGTSGTTFSGDLKFAQASASTFTIAATINNLDLSQASSSGTSFDLDFSPTDVSTIAGLLKNDKSVQVQLSGTLSEGPASFSVEVTINATITADAL
ncbi:MAG: hypothetical protein RLN86_05425 [Cyclobacteriaceae bacterium]